ncbi:MAG TPA: NAD(P)H-hydrate epimerase, partial [Phenylobacterium sp.]|nr:NAD(P)H-hydrate epimerase [Phenylobacterium sp.]
MERADAAAIAAGTPGLTLMERAGTAVADTVCARFSKQMTTVLCGPGNNGGDGYVAARLLKDRGWPVEVRSFGTPATQDARAASARWDGTTKPLNGALEPGVWIDALFGAGLSRALDGPAAAAALRMAETPERVVAVDVPSGVPGDTGTPSGPAARASVTVTFHAKKPAHLLEPGHGRCGEVIVAD